MTTCVICHSRTWHSQRAADLDCAHRDDQPLRRATCPRGSSRSSPMPTRARCCRKTAPGPRKRWSITPCRLWRDKHRRPRTCPTILSTPQTLAPLDHVKMQAAAQEWVDSSISKTINCPEDIGFEEFKDVYLEAYRNRLQGLHHLPPQRGDGVSFDRVRNHRCRTGRRRPEHEVSGDAQFRWRCCVYRRSRWIVRRSLGRATPTSSNGPIASMRFTSPSTISCVGGRRQSVRGVYQLQKYGALTPGPWR